MVVNRRPRLIIIVGPTGVGKTEVALRIAEASGGEIISADSMQVYRYMDIGTAKPSKADRTIAPHHLIDLVDPDESFNAAMYAKLAREVIQEAEGKDKTFFIVGGAGLYIRALLGGIFSGPGADEPLREYYRNQLKRFGKEYLYRILKEKDEKAACAIRQGDTVRIIRALEVFELTGKSILDKQQEHHFGDRPYSCLKIGLTMGMGQLFERIEKRTESMMAVGFIDEVRWLLDQGYHEGLKSMQSLGYRHMVRYLSGLSNLQDAVYSMKRDTRHYAKRQMTWFNADREVNWFSFADTASIGERIKSFLQGAAYGVRSAENARNVLT
jgi:tRNA dimethylallyltransferase